MSQVTSLGSTGDVSSAPAFSCPHGSAGEDTAFVRPAGELDIATAPQLDHALQAALKGAHLVVLDLSELDFIDSSGVHVIAGATSAARAMGRRVRTVRGPGPVHGIFALTEGRTGIDFYEAGESAPDAARAEPGEAEEAQVIDLDSRRASSSSG